MKLIKFISLLMLVGMGVYPEEDVKEFTITPALNYEYFSFGDQKIHSPGEGLIFSRGNMEPDFTEDRNNLLLTGKFKQYFLQENEYSNLYHSVAITFDKTIKRHSFHGRLYGDSDKPFYGGLSTFAGGFGYGYQFIYTKNISLMLGLGLGVGNLGIEIDDELLPVLPIPIFQLKVANSFIDLNLQFFAKPELFIILFPENKIRLNGYFSINKFTEFRDLKYDISLMYHLFSEESKFGNFAKIGIGTTNGGFGFNLAEKGQSYNFLYNSVHGIIDLSFLQIRAGYVFNGLESYDSNIKKDIGDGFFINATLVWQF